MISLNLSIVKLNLSRIELFKIFVKCEIKELKFELLNDLIF